MKVFFNLAGAVLLLVGLFFTATAYGIGSLTGAAGAEEHGELAFAFGAAAVNSQVQDALLAFIGAGVFLGAGAILQAFESRRQEVD